MIWLVGGFFVTALLYAAVGFGGGSTYSALMALAGVDYRILPLISLACNIVVVAGSTIRFARAGVTPWRGAIEALSFSSVRYYCFLAAAICGVLALGAFVANGAIGQVEPEVGILAVALQGEALFAVGPHLPLQDGFVNRMGKVL